MILVGQVFAVAAPAFGGGLSGVQEEMKAGYTMIIPGWHPIRSRTAVKHWIEVKSAIKA